MSTDRRIREIRLAITLAGCLLPSSLIAQDPAPKPTPLPGPTVRPGAAPVIVPRPAAPRSGPEPIDRRGLKPDLELAMSPRSATTPPTEFTVRNAGLGRADEASLLRVSIRALPLDEAGQEMLFGGPLAGLAAAATGVSFSELADQRFAEMCTLPYAEFQEAIPPLDEGATHVVSKSRLSRIGGVVDLGMALSGAGATPTNSYVKQIEIRVVCVYEVRGIVDANANVDESSERNNEAVQHFQREVTLR